MSPAVCHAFSSVEVHIHSTGSFDNGTLTTVGDQLVCNNYCVVVL